MKKGDTVVAMSPDQSGFAAFGSKILPASIALARLGFRAAPAHP